MQRPAPEGSAPQLIRLCQFLAEDRSLDRAAFRLWVEDYTIPLERIRKALGRLAPNPKMVFGETDERISTKVEQYAESLRRKKGVKPHVKRMIDDGRFAAMLQGFLSMGLGRAVHAEQQPKLGADFEELSGLSRARSDHWAGQSPWLTGDTTQELMVAASLLESISANLAATASEADFAKAKEAFKALVILRNCASLLQQLHGPNVFGFGVLTDLPIGLPMSYVDPSAFVGLIALAQTRPEILDNTIRLGSSLQVTLVSLRQQVEEPTKFSNVN